MKVTGRKVLFAVMLIAWVAVVLALLSDLARAQTTTINGQRTVSSALTVNGATTLTGTTKTINFEASLPATCTAPSGSTPGECVFRTSDNTLHCCTATNTFTQIGGGGGGGCTVTEAAFASIPGSPAECDTWIQTRSDGPYMAVYDGASWRYSAYGLHNRIVPPSSGWTALNSASISATGGERVLTVPGSGADNVRAEVRTLSGDTTFEGCFDVMASANNFTQFGIIIRESGTGKFVIYNVRNDGVVQAVQWTGFGAISGTYTPTNTFSVKTRGPVCFRMVFGPTNRVITVSDGGSYLELHTVAKEDFATTAYDQYGWMANNSNGLPMTVRLFHWEE